VSLTSARQGEVLVVIENYPGAVVVGQLCTLVGYMPSADGHSQLAKVTIPPARPGVASVQMTLPLWCLRELERE
jgi:hypothetical protein